VTGRCWKPRCPRDAAVQLTGGDWTLTTCTRHEPIARYVTGCAAVRGRNRQMELALDSEVV
jgi:hypothetical protein